LDVTAAGLFSDLIALAVSNTRDVGP